jgi:hypothetical protein
VLLPLLIDKYQEPQPKPKGNQSMDKRQLLNSITSSDTLDHTAISSLANRQEREKAVRDFINSVIRTEGKEIILVSVVRR